MILGHMGENIPFSLARSQMAFSRGASNLKRPVSEYFQEHFWLTTSGYFTPPPFLCMLQVVGADRILFSVDYPFSPNDMGRKFLDSLAVCREDLRKSRTATPKPLLSFELPFRCTPAAQSAVSDCPSSAIPTLAASHSQSTRAAHENTLLGSSYSGLFRFWPPCLCVFVVTLYAIAPTLHRLVRDRTEDYLPRAIRKHHPVRHLRCLRLPSYPRSHQRA